MTETAEFFYTTDFGRTWNPLTGPILPNSFGVPILHFHPQQSDYLLWTGNVNCAGSVSADCHVETYFSRDNGRKWEFVEKYVRNCAWARDDELKIDPTQILCESYKEKSGNQRFFTSDNALELVSGTNFFNKKTKIFDNVVGFAKFSEFLIVAEVGSN